MSLIIEIIIFSVQFILFPEFFLKLLNYPVEKSYYE